MWPWEEVLKTFLDNILRIYGLDHCAYEISKDIYCLLTSNPGTIRRLEPLLHNQSFDHQQPVGGGLL